jgi:hypothetical protein
MTFPVTRVPSAFSKTMPFRPHPLITRTLWETSLADSFTASAWTGQRPVPTLLVPTPTACSPSRLLPCNYLRRQHGTKRVHVSAETTSLFGRRHESRHMRESVSSCSARPLRFSGQNPQGGLLGSADVSGNPHEYWMEVWRPRQDLNPCN